MAWWYKYQKKSKENHFMANVREVAEAGTQKEAEEKLQEATKRRNVSLCSLLHGSYSTEEEARTAYLYPPEWWFILAKNGKKKHSLQMFKVQLEEISPMSFIEVVSQCSDHFQCVVELV